MIENVKECVKKLRSKSYYVNLLEILVLNGLLDVFDKELQDNKIDYIPLTINLLKFLNDNKKHYKNFSSDTFEKIIILSIDEILTKKFNLELDEEQIKNVLELVKNTYLIRTLISKIRDTLIKIYYKCRCKSCTSVGTDSIKQIELDLRR